MHVYTSSYNAIAYKAAHHHLQMLTSISRCSAGVLHAVRNSPKLNIRSSLSPANSTIKYVSSSSGAVVGESKAVDADGLQVKPIPRIGKYMIAAGAAGLVASPFTDYTLQIASIASVASLLGLAVVIPPLIDSKSMLARHEALLRKRLKEETPRSRLGKLYDDASLAVSYIFSRNQLSRMVQKSQDESRLGRYLVYNLGYRLQRSRLLWEFCGRQTVFGAPMKLVENPQKPSELHVALPIIHERLGQRGVLNVELTLKRNVYAGHAAADVPASSADSEIVPVRNAMSLLATKGANAAAFPKLERVRRDRLEQRFKAREARTKKDKEPLGSMQDGIDFFRSVQEDMQDEVKALNMLPAIVFDVHKAILVTTGKQIVDVTRDFEGVVHDDISRGFALDPEKAHAYKPPQAKDSTSS